MWGRHGGKGMGGRREKEIARMLGGKKRGREGMPGPCLTKLQGTHVLKVHRHGMLSVGEQGTMNVEQ